MKDIRLGIAGLGTVAQGVLEIIGRNQALIAQRSGVRLSVSRVSSRTAKEEIDLLGGRFSTRLEDLLADDVDMVLELIGGESVAAEFIAHALAAGKPVVTANKAVIARHGNQLLNNNDHMPLKFEAAVAGAIPIIQAIQHALVVNQFQQVVGIINGTCNFILTAMEEQGQTFTDALSEAQALGYAEAEPGFDIDGIDAAHKLTILTGLAFDTPFDFEALHVEGITGITADDIRFAQELGYKIKHVGIARCTADGIEARVHPALVPADRLLANVNGVANAVVVDGDASGQTLFSGPGAGGSATASAVLADVVALGVNDAFSAPPQAAGESRFLSIAQVRCVHYVRIQVQDEPGVFAQVANALSSHGISIEAAIQKEPADGQSIVPIVILTQNVAEAAVDAALEEVSKLPQVVGDIARIRVVSL